ncbi:DNA cytosine methyltransferase, partial [Rhodococcus hoagii]|nr:DNA cytosine methyltransferase [Prescottella equi]
TMARIEDGLKRMGAEPFLHIQRGEFPQPFGFRPGPTIVAAPNSVGLLVPVEGRDGKEARSAADPLRTMTTRNETALLVPYYGKGVARTSDDPHGTFTTRDKYAFVVPLRANNTPKPSAEPYDTFAANGNHHALAQADTVDVDDCLFRMLEPHEIAAGMAFPREYRILGNKREQVRQAGNAVCPPNARDLIAAVAESLGVAA